MSYSSALIVETAPSLTPSMRILNQTTCSTKTAAHHKRMMVTTVHPALVILVVKVETILALA